MSKQDPMLNMFDAFVHRETALTDTAKYHLVRPSGDLDIANCGVLLHYPMFTTDLNSTTDILGTADTSKGPIRRLLQKGFPDETFYLNLYARRRRATLNDCGTLMSAELRQLSQDFAESILHELSIWTLCGQHVDAWYRSLARNQKPSQFGRTSGYLEIDNSGSKVVRVIISGQDPHFLLSSTASMSIAQAMDRSFNLLASLAEIDSVNHVYFERFFRAYVPSQRWRFENQVPRPDEELIIHHPHAISGFEKVLQHIADLATSDMGEFNEWPADLRHWLASYEVDSIEEALMWGSHGMLGSSKSMSITSRESDSMTSEGSDSMTKSGPFGQLIQKMSLLVTRELDAAKAYLSSWEPSTKSPRLKWHWQSLPERNVIHVAGADEPTKLLVFCDVCNKTLYDLYPTSLDDIEGYVVRRLACSTC